MVTLYGEHAHSDAGSHYRSVLVLADVSHDRVVFEVGHLLPSLAARSGAWDRTERVELTAAEWDALVAEVDGRQARAEAG